MPSEDTLKKLRALSSDLVLVDASSSMEEWWSIAADAEGLADAFGLENEIQAKELADLLAKIAATLSKGMIANPGAGVKAIQSIIDVLQDVENLSGMVESHRKQAQAEANLFFRDARKEEELVEEATTFDDDDERREMIMAIEQRVDELEADLLALSPPVFDAEEVRAIFRQFHTLKGEGAICGMQAVADFCHGIETEIEDARSGTLVLTADIVSILQELTATLRPILAGESRETIELDLIDALMKELNSAVQASKSTLSGGEDLPEATPSEDDFADFFSGFTPPHPGVEEEAKEKLDVEPMDARGWANPLPTREPEPAAAIAPTPLENRKPAIAPAVHLAAAQVPAGIPDGVGPSSEALRGEVAEKKIEEAKVKAISVDVNRLDELLEITGEVSLIGSYITTSLRGTDNLALQTTNLLRACSRLQEIANSMRMTSIRPLFMAVRRAAADAARASRKLIDIDMEGIDTQVDRSIVESLSAALIHIVRNAVDHGIEPAEERRQRGKPERGTITIAATRTNADIVIELGDDGQGFNLDAIRRKAMEMGRIGRDDTLSSEELAELVFLPGLSTAKELTGLSGRGVGMEIVRESLDALQGKVEITTTEGHGSLVRMRFPLTVAAMDVMLVRVGESILAVPVSQVRECFRARPGDVGTLEGRDTIVTIRGIILPVLFLDREFGIQGHAKRPEDGVLVVVETGEKLAAVLVDEMLGASQVVVRSLEGPLAQSNLVAGAAVLPDGRVGLVIETTELTSRVATVAAKAFREAGSRQAENSRQVDTVAIGSNQVGMIDFCIRAPDDRGGSRTHIFAINAFKTREFVPLTALRSIPNSPRGFAGMMLLRDTTIPVVHMGVVLGLLKEEDRRPEWEEIVLVCEFSGKTVGFLVSSVERVSYISWEDIMPPPSTGGLIDLEYVVGTILMSTLNGTLGGRSVNRHLVTKTDDSQVAFVLDFERIVGNVLELYGDMGSELHSVTAGRTNEARILLVEDSPLIRKQTKKALSAAGITVIEAGDGQEAWDMICQFQRKAASLRESIFTCLDLVLSDIEMPRMDGYTLAHNIKQDLELRVLPVLLHSSITNDGMIGRAAEVEADGFIPKCDPKELALQLRKYL